MSSNIGTVCPKIFLQVQKVLGHYAVHCTNVGVHGSNLQDVLACQKVPSSQIFRPKNDDLDLKISNEPGPLLMIN